MNKWVILTTLGITSVIFLAAIILSGQKPSPKPMTTNSTPIAIPKAIPSGGPPKMVIDIAKIYSAILNTSEGKITVEFNAKDTPVTVNNFVSLARAGFYNNTIFHRVISGFMIQGGDPKGNGTGGPGYKFADEPITAEYLRGTVAMANSGPDTNGSQFFIMHKDYPLPKNYVIFGQVVSGIEVVDKIATAQVRQGFSGENSTPVNPVKILSVEITEK